MCDYDLISLRTKKSRVTLNRKLMITQGGHWCPLKPISVASLSLERYVEHNPMKRQNPSSNYHLQIKVLFRKILEYEI